MMKELPILFSAPMVRAILDGSKTQTRRIVKPHPNDDAFCLVDYGDGWWPYRSEDGESPNVDNMEYPLNCPYGRPGHRLWVRETWAHDARSLEECRAAHEDVMGGCTYGPYYRATEQAPETLLWRPSIHMPRWASRILLEVTGVRVERLQDISEADAIAEGIERSVEHPTLWKRGSLHGDQNTVKVTAFPKLAYRSIWEQINGAESWAANPWVWVVEFKRIDQLQAAA